VVLPVVLTLLVQAVVSMSAVAIPVLMPEAAGELNIPASYVGILMSLIYLGATAIVPVSGYFISRFGPIGVSQICLVLSAVGLGAVSIPSLPVMLSGAVLMGIGYGPVTPASSHVLVRTTPISILAIVFSIKQTGVPLGGALAGAIVPQLVVLCGWKISALWVAGFNIVLALFLLPFRKRFDTEISSRTIFSWKNAVEPVKMTLLQPELRQLGVTSFFFSTMQLCLVSFLVTFLIERIEMTLIQAGVLLSAAQASGIIGRILWGGLADRFVNPRIMLGFLGLAMTVCAFGTALFSSDWSFPAILIVCTLFGATAVGWNGVYLAEVARVAKPELAGMATGGTLFFTFLGILLGLPTFSLIVETTGSYPLAFVIVALTTLVCGLRLLFARTPH
jgi:MFS family permease